MPAAASIFISKGATHVSRNPLRPDATLARRDTKTWQPLVVMLFITIAMLSPLCLSTARGERKPNVVLIFIDDLGYGDIGPFGNTSHKTPHLDKLAAQGMKFTSFYAKPVCTMSRAALMTGCYNTRVSVQGVLHASDNRGLHPDEWTLGDAAKSQGYATTCIGKWHLGHREEFLPTKQGFDSYFGIPYSNDMTIDVKNARFAKDCLFTEGMTREQAIAKAIKNKVPLMRNTEIVEYPVQQATLTKRLTEEAVTFIRSNKDKPFFLYLPHVMVHRPLAASPDFRGKSGNGILGDAIEEIDWSVGQIMQTLSELKLDENTLVIFTSDNGPASGSAGPFRGKKGSIFEGGVREPCIMRWPGRIPAGTSNPQIAGNIDVLPTISRLIGAPMPKGRIIDGKDISSLMFAADAPPVRDTHLYITGAGAVGAIRQGNWKLFVIPVAGAVAKREAAAVQKANPNAKGPMLFDLAKDPGEANNIAADHPEIVAKLQAQAQQMAQELNENRRPPGLVAASPKP